MQNSCRLNNTRNMYLLPIQFMIWNHIFTLLFESNLFSIMNFDALHRFQSSNFDDFDRYTNVGLHFTSFSNLLYLILKRAKTPMGTLKTLKKSSSCELWHCKLLQLLRFNRDKKSLVNCFLTNYCRVLVYFYVKII